MMVLDLTLIPRRLPKHEASKLGHLHRMNSLFRYWSYEERYMAFTPTSMS